MRVLLALVALSFFVTALVQADDKNLGRAGYSYFGGGFDYSQYRETITLNLANTPEVASIGAIAVETKSSPAVMYTQRGGGYVSHASGWGFYIQTENSVGNKNTKESWYIDGELAQRDVFTLSRNDIRLLVSKQLDSHQAILFGGGVKNTKFTRFSWSYYPVLIPRLSAAENASLNAFLAGGQSGGSITEELFKIYPYLGYELGNFFLKDQLGWSWQVQAVAGLPIYSSVINTSMGNETLNGGFDGYSLDLEVSLGYRVTRNFMAGVSLKAAYEYQQRITEGRYSLPNNRFSYFFPGASFYWSF